MPLWLMIGAPLGLLTVLFGSKAKAAATTLISSSAYLKEPQWSKYDALFKKYGTQYGVDWKWLKAISMNESGIGTHPSVVLGLKEPNNPKSVSDDKKSWGLMQILVSTANDFMKGATFADLNNPETAVKIAAQLFAANKKWFPKDSGNALMEKVVKSYNQGAGNTLKGKTYADTYWDRFQRNLKIVNDKQPG